MRSAGVAGVPPEHPSLPERTVPEHRQRVRPVLQADARLRVHRRDPRPAARPARAHQPAEVDRQRRHEEPDGDALSRPRAARRRAAALGESGAREDAEEGRRAAGPADAPQLRAQGARRDHRRRVLREDGLSPPLPRASLPGLLEGQKGLLPASGVRTVTPSTRRRSLADVDGRFPAGSPTPSS